MMRLCENCLGSYDDVQGVPVGHDKGSQRDPYRESRLLCGTCGQALLTGDWDTIHERYARERTVRREEIGRGGSA